MNHAWAENFTISPDNPTIDNSAMGGGESSSDHTISVTSGSYDDNVVIKNNGGDGVGGSGGDAGILEISLITSNGQFQGFSVENNGGGSGGYGGGKGGTVTWTLTGEENNFQDAVTLNANGSYGGDGKGGEITLSNSGGRAVFQETVTFNANNGGYVGNGEAGIVKMDFVGSSVAEFQKAVTTNLSGRESTGSFILAIKDNAEVVFASDLTISDNLKQSEINLSDNGTLRLNNLSGLQTMNVFDGTSYFSGNATVSTLNIDGSAQSSPNVTFGADSISTVDNRLNIQNATLTFELDVNADSRDVNNPYIDATGVASVNVKSMTVNVKLTDDFQATQSQKVLLVKANSNDLSDLETGVIENNL